MLEHLLTHGPESVAEEFQSDKDVIGQMKCFQHIDDSGYVFSFPFSLLFFLLQLVHGKIFIIIILRVTYRVICN